MGATKAAPEPPVADGWAQASRTLPGRAWWWVLTGSGLLVAVSVGLRLAGQAWAPVALAAQSVVSVAGVAAMVVGVVTYRPAHPAVWWLLAGGYALGLLGWLWGQRWPDAPFPSVADASFLASAAMGILGLLLMARARIVAGRDGALGGVAVIDSLTVMALLLWLLLNFLALPGMIHPAIIDPAAPLTFRGPAAARLSIDALLVAVVGLLAVGGRLRPRSSVSATLVMACVALVLLDDLGSRLAILAGTPTVGVGSLLGVATIGAAALHPSMRTLTRPPHQSPAQPRPHRIGRIDGAGMAERLTLLTVALLVGITVLAPLLVHWLVSPLRPPTAVLATGLVAVALPWLAYLAGQALATVAHGRRYRRLLTETIRAKEHERLQVAAELHDGPIQRLTAMGFTAERARSRIAKRNLDDAERLLEQLTGELEHEVAELRRVIVQLRPSILAELGLVQALRDHVHGFQRRTGIRFDLDIDPQVRLDAQRETILYWAAQELLLNVTKHARARHVRIGLDLHDGTAHLNIRDDGHGFNPETLRDLHDQRHFGLAGTRDRVEMAGGTLRIDSHPGQGTAITISLPPAG
jgi:signal transduction histidine kinase